MVLCAKRLIAGAGATPTHYLINSMLLCSNEELAHRRTHKSYSETFELLIMDHDNAAAVTTPPAKKNSTRKCKINHAVINLLLQIWQQIEICNRYQFYNTWQLL